MEDACEEEVDKKIIKSKLAKIFTQNNKVVRRITFATIDRKFHERRDLL